MLYLALERDTWYGFWSRLQALHTIGPSWWPGGYEDYGVFLEL